MSARRIVRAALALVCALALTNCARPEFQLRFEPAGAALTGQAAERLAASSDVSALADVNTADAPSMRNTVLAGLRTHGALGVRAADLLTAGFPDRTEAVPVLVRVCAVDGIDTILVVEAFGDASGPLTHRRLWVFDRSSGNVTRAASFR